MLEINRPMKRQIRDRVVCLYCGMISVIGHDLSSLHTTSWSTKYRGRTIQLQ